MNHTSNCHFVRTQLMEYAYGELDDSHRDAVQRHLPGCETCRQQLALFEQTRELIDQAAHQTSEEASVNSAPIYGAWCQRRLRASRRWAVGSAIAITMTLVFAVTSMALRVELFQDHVVIRWARAPNPPPTPEDRPVEDGRRPSTEMLATAERLDALERFADLVVTDLIDNQRRAQQANVQFEKSTGQLRRRLETLEAIRANDERRWLVLGQSIQANRITPAVNRE